VLAQSKLLSGEGLSRSPRERVYTPAQNEGKALSVSCTREFRVASNFGGPPETHMCGAAHERIGTSYSRHSNSKHVHGTANQV
jgi:hypothetical protein